MKTLSLVGLAVALLIGAFFGYRTYGEREEGLLPSTLDSGERRQARRPDAALADLGPVRADSEREAVADEVATGAFYMGADSSEGDASADGADESGIDWRILVDRIRRAATEREPHLSAWPHVQALTKIARNNLVDGSPGPIAVELEALIRDAGRSSFVRGALLLTLGMAYPTDLAHALVREFRSEPPGELARAAWLAGRLTGDAGIDLGRFEAPHSKAARTIWPVMVLASPDDSSLEEALAELLPTTLYWSGAAGDRTPQSAERRREGYLTRETIVLALLSGGAREPGPVRDRLLEWATGTDMSHACIWSLCMAARDDHDLALSLRSMLLGLDPSSSEGRLLAMLLVGLAQRSDLVFDLLETTLTFPDENDRRTPNLQELNALFALGNILDSDDPELSERAAQLLTDIALDSTRPDALRKLTLDELSDANSARVPDMIELILISPDSAEMKKWASLLGRFAPESQRQSIRDTLMDTYTIDLAPDVQQSYVKTLISLGGDDVHLFLSQLRDAEGLSDGIRAKIEDYLDG